MNKEEKPKTPNLITGEEKLREFIKELIRQELSRQEGLEEMSGTSSVGPISTPKCFTPGGRKPKVTPVLRRMGYTPTGVEEETLTEHLKKAETLIEVATRYTRLKEHPRKNHSKISLIVQEIIKMLRDVEFLAKVGSRLKADVDVPKEDLWKRTEMRIAEIREKLKSIGSKLKTFER